MASVLAVQRQFAAAAAAAAPSGGLRRAQLSRRPLAVAARAAAAKGEKYICVDCGWIYDGKQGPFEKLPSSYRCPVCNAPKRRFNKVASSAKGASSSSRSSRSADDGKLDAGDKSFFVAAAAGGAALLGALYFVLQSQTAM